MFIIRIVLLATLPMLFFALFLIFIGFSRVLGISELADSYFIGVNGWILILTAVTISCAVQCVIVLCRKYLIGKT